MAKLKGKTESGESMTDKIYIEHSKENECSHKLQPVYTSVSSCNTILDCYRCCKCGKIFSTNEV